MDIKLGAERAPNIVYHVLRNYFRGRILDAGCGSGRCLTLMPEGSIGLDLAPNRALQGKYELIIADLDRALPFRDKVFDVIFCSQVLEHLEAPYRALREFHRILKDDGKLIIGIPNPDWIIFDYYTTSWRDHLYAWNLKQAQRFIRNCGFEIERTYCNFPFGKTVGKIFNHKLFPKKLLAPDFYFVAVKSKSVAFKDSKRNILNKILARLFGNICSVPACESRRSG